MQLALSCPGPHLTSRAVTGPSAGMIWGSLQSSRVRPPCLAETGQQVVPLGRPLGRRPRRQNRLEEHLGKKCEGLSLKMVRGLQR